MKRLSVIAPMQKRRTVIRRLYRLGCVELERQENPPEALTLQLEDTNAEKDRQTLDQALSVLSRVAPAKKSILAPRREVEEHTLFESGRKAQAVGRAREILSLWERYEAAKNVIAHLEAQEMALEPWRGLAVPLSFAGTEHTSFICGVLPVQTAFETAADALNLLPAELTRIGADAEQTYCTLLCHHNAEEEALFALKPLGFTKMAFREQNTPTEELDHLRAQITAEQNTMEESRRAVAALTAERPLLEDISDALEGETGCDRLLSESPRTKKTVYLLGWVPEKTVKAVGQTLEEIGCAWECREPAEDEAPPTLMESGPISSPFRAITTMYGTPEYGSIVDPNPIMAPFYAIFFGFMMCDAAYGILIFLACLLALKKMKPTGEMRSLLKVFMYCGITTFIAGVLTGGWFADAIPAFTGTFLSREITIEPRWFDPLEEPMRMLIFSMVLGALQIVIGMAMSAYRQIKKGDIKGAFLDTGSWYMIFLGLGLLAGGKLSSLPDGFATAGAVLAITGALLVVGFSARDAKGGGRIGGGLYNLYGISGYVSDIFSYSRIMALGLSGTVVGQVVNKMGIMGGRSIFGFLLFIFAFTVGHAFNISVSVLGAYVHSCRLQYIEFFGKFFASGGRAFRPLFIKTRYVNIIREEQ